MNKKNWFTLIELVISITIIWILFLLSYAPYSFYQKKASLKVTSREISQILSEARNMAINWAVTNTWNISIWVYFDSSSNFSNNNIKIFSYPHNIDKININKEAWWNIHLIKTLQLKKWIIIDNIISKDNLLFFFESITWKLTYYTWEWMNKIELEQDKIDITFSYKWSTNLNKTIEYFTNTNIMEY